MPWFYVEKDTHPITENSNGYFRNYFYKNQMPCHPYYEDCIPLLNEIGCVTPIEIRANLNFRDIDSKSSGFHTDNNHKYVKTALLFFTTCNAKTMFNDTLALSLSVEYELCNHLLLKTLAWLPIS